jgi:uncharacterized protein
MNKTFVGYIVRPFFTNKLKEIVKQPKIYFFDIGFLNHILAFDVDEGKKLEQVIMMELIKSESDIKYWKSKDQMEMDFVVQKDNKIVRAIESKISGKTSDSFKAFTRAYPEIESVVVTTETVFDIAS